MQILSLTDQAVSELSPGAYDALRAWSDDPVHAAAHLATAERLGQQLEQKLREIDERMDQWGQLQELIAIAQNIRDIELSLTESPTTKPPVKDTDPR
jgi:hypothetical protein